uniref:IS4 family transposase n=1 Tax=Mesocestoides corti TaxID=53468 RepID=A0A5K3EJQ0_MESCO
EQALLTNHKLETLIRVHYADHAAQYILHLIRVLLWLAAYLVRMALKRRETQEWLRPGGPICLRPDPSPQSETGATA